MPKLFIHFLNSDQQQALKDAGHEVAVFAGSETDKLITAAKAKFPDLVATIKKGIADATDKDTRGVEKLEAVALDAVAAFPEVLKALPDAKSFAIGLVQSVYQDGLTELEKVAGQLILKLL